jgi:hypothetical protein
VRGAKGTLFPSPNLNISLRGDLNVKGGVLIGDCKKRATVKPAYYKLSPRSLTPTLKKREDDENGNNNECNFTESSGPIVHAFLYPFVLNLYPGPKVNQ